MDPTPLKRYRPDPPGGSLGLDLPTTNRYGLSTQTLGPVYVGPDMPPTRGSSYRGYRGAARSFRRSRRSRMRRSGYARVSRVPASASVAALSGLGLGTTQVVNRQPANQIFRCTRTASSEGNGIYITGGNSAQGGVCVFDPLGSQSWYGGWGSSSGSRFQISDATNFTGLFDQYRVTKIDLNIRALNATGASVNVLDIHPVTFLGRFCYDKQLAAASMPLSQIYFTGPADVKQHIFTPTNPQCSWTVYPMVQSVVQTEGVLAAQGGAPVPMSWTDVENTVPLYGFQWRTPNIAGSGGDAIQMYMDVTYHLEFRYNN